MRLLPRRPFAVRWGVSRESLAVVVLALLVGGCYPERLVPCGDVLCPVGTLCVGDVCARRDQLDACAERDDGALCTLAGIGEGICRDTLCVIPKCGDGYLDVLAGEACDDGNGDDGDGCARDCRSNESCGNGVRDLGEQCDDGNAVDGDGCQSTCRLPVCGDGVVDATQGEECDSGADNDNASDRCRLTCRAPYCGDRIRDIGRGEACDDSNLIAGDGCTPDCSSDESCGNGKVDPFTSEICDDGNLRNHDGCSPECGFETAAWTRQGIQPPARQGRVAGYDPVRERVVLFGGFGCVGGTCWHNDTWEWNGTGWAQISPPASPPGSTGGFMTYDAARGRLVLLGGTDSLGGPIGTWEWDGSAWRPFGAGPSPAAIAYDPVRQRVIALEPFADDPAINSMWSYDGTWTQSFPDPVPPPRRGYSITWDPSTQHIVLWGGYDENGVLDDMWDWDGTSWSPRSQDAAPSPRSNAGLAYDTSRQKLVLYGGGGLRDTWEWTGTGWALQTASAIPPNEFNLTIQVFYDTRIGRVTLVPSSVQPWVWDGASWSSFPAPLVPQERYHSPRVYQLSRKRFLMFGGLGSSVPNDTWEWDGAAWLKQAPSTTPGARYHHGLAYDIERDRTVMFGGSILSVGATNQTWEWNGTDWSDPAPATAPPARAEPQLAYDPISKRVILFSGAQATNDTWAWNGTTWTQLAPTSSPSARAGQPFFYDPTRGGLVLFGDDTWRWTGSNWEMLNSVAAPSVMVAPTAAGPVAVDGSILTDRHDDVWLWRDGAWQHFTAARFPIYRTYNSIAFDPIEDRIFMYGGYSNNHNMFDDTWTLRFESPFPDEVCASGIDTNGDGYSGCQDTDCWSTCSPLCAPDAEPELACDPTGLAQPYCGDGTCSPFELPAVCTADCP